MGVVENHAPSSNSILKRVSKKDLMNLVRFLTEVANVSGNSHRPIGINELTKDKRYERFY